MLIDLVAHRRALYREQRTAVADERKAPASQAIERRDGPRRHDVRRTQPRHALLGPATNHLDPLEAQFLHDLVQERHTPGQRLDENDVKIGARHRHHDTGQTSTRTDVYDISVRRHQVGDGGAVEQMPVPDRAASRGPIRPRVTPSVTSLPA